MQQARPGGLGKWCPVYDDEVQRARAFRSKQWRPAPVISAADRRANTIAALSTNKHDLQPADGELRCKQCHKRQPQDDWSADKSTCPVLPLPGGRLTHDLQPTGRVRRQRQEQRVPPATWTGTSLPTERFQLPGDMLQGQVLASVER